MSSLLNNVEGAAGLRSSWEGDRARQAAEQQAAANAANINSWRTNQNTLNDYSTQIAGTNYSQNAQAQYQNQVANYNQQQQAAGLLYNQATGNAPSMADLQMQAGLGQANNAAQSAMLSQQGGVSPGLSQRNMLNAQAMQNAQIVSSGAANRAQELATAQNNYSNLLGNMGQTAAGMSNQQYNYGQQAYNQQMNNLGYQTQAQTQGAQMGTANAATNYAANMANVVGQSTANTAQYQAVGNDISEGFGALTSIIKNRPDGGY